MAAKFAAAVADADVLLGIKAPLGQQSLALGRFKRLFCAVDPAGAQTDAGRGQQQIAHHKAGVLHAVGVILLAQDQHRGGCAVERVVLGAHDGGVQAGQLP